MFAKKKKKKKKKKYYISRFLVFVGRHDSD